MSSNPAHGELYSIHHYVIKFVSDLRQVGGFLQILRTDRNDIAEILLKGRTTPYPNPNPTHFLIHSKDILKLNKTHRHDITEILLKVGLQHHNP